MVSGGGISLQFVEVPVKVVLEQFLMEGILKAVGSVDDNLNNETYNYVGLTDVVATPWHQTNPVKPIHTAEIYLKITEILLVCPLDSTGRDSINRMAHTEPVVLYIGDLAINGNLFTGADVPVAGLMEAMPKRFLAIEEVSVFPMFPPRTTMPEGMPIGMVNRAKITHYHRPTQ